MEEIIEREVEIYKTEQGKDPFKEWYKKLDTRLQMKILARLEAVQQGNLGEHKFLSDGVSELKFRDGIRIYYSEINKVIVLLLCGGGKNTKRDQNRDIEKAKELLKEFKERSKC